MPEAPAGTADAAVVICAYTEARFADLEQAVAGVLAQRPRPREVFVAVDGNPALLARAAAAFPGVRVLANDHGPGASGARNAAARRATAALLVFLDDDAFPEPGWMQAITDAYACDRGVVGVGGPVEPLWRGTVPRWLTEEFHWVVGCTWTGFGAGADVRNAIGANFSMRRDVYEAVGGFAQELGRREAAGRRRVTGTGEESELCIRAVAAHPGSRIAFAPAMRVRHVVPPARGRWAYYRRRCRLEGASKAVLVQRTGAGSGLASERGYVAGILPRALARELGSGSPGGIVRAGAILAGLAYTATEYARVRLALRVGRATSFVS